MDSPNKGKKGEQEKKTLELQYRGERTDCGPECEELESYKSLRRVYIGKPSTQVYLIELGSCDAIIHGNHLQNNCIKTNKYLQ